MLSNCVVLDTNAYRSLAIGRPTHQAAALGRELRERDIGNHAQALACPTVLLEILSHLSDPADPAYSECLSAVALIWEHCRTELGGRRQLATMEDAEAQLCVTVCGVCLVDNYRLLQGIARVVEVVGANPRTDVVMELGRDLASIRTTTEAVESQFVSDMEKFVLRGFKADAVTWKDVCEDPIARGKALADLRAPTALPDLAKAFVYKALEMAGISASDRPVEELVGVLLANHSTPLHLYRNLCEKVAANGLDMRDSHNRNTIWDLQVAAAAGELTLMGGLGVTLVTGDRAILRAAKDAGFGTKVETLKDYSRRSSRR